MSLSKEQKSEIFIKRVQTLIDTGEVKNYTEVIKALNWSKSMFSSVMHGNALVPSDKFAEFNKVYPTVTISKVSEVSMETLLRLEAMGTVILSTLAEVLAHQKGHPVAKVNEDLVAMVNSQVKRRLEKL